MSRFLEAMRSGRVLLMDGAMGTELQRAGIQEGECYELWNLTHPERVRGIHRSYVLAGAQCVVTNTFQANPFTLEKHGIENELERIIRTAVEISRSVCGVNHFVLGSIGPIAHYSDRMRVVGDGSTAWLQRVVGSFAGVDALLLETWDDFRSVFLIDPERALNLLLDPPQELNWNPHGLPVLISLTYRRGLIGKLFGLEGSTPAERAALSFESPCNQLAALGVNCGRDIGMDDIIEIIRRYRQATDLPLFARPNAGTPTRDGDRWVYPHTPAQMAARLPELLEAGVSMIGGCCGTTPEHIAAFRPIVDAWNARQR